MNRLTPMLMGNRMCLGILCIVLHAPLSVQCSQPRLAVPGSPADLVEIRGEHYRLTDPRDLERFDTDLGKWLEDGTTRRSEWLALRKVERGDRKLAELSNEELLSYVHPPEDVLATKELRCLSELQSRVAVLKTSPSRDRALDLHREVKEICLALANHRRDPVPHMDMFTVPVLAIDFLDNSIGGGTQPALNVEDASDAPEADPPASTFWTPDRVIEKQNLYSGFGRDSIPDWEAFIWKYDEPKTGTGVHPGFEVRHGELKAKIKFAERLSEPLTARFLYAMGYHVDPTDYVSSLRVKYNRRILREFNLRQELMMRFRLIGPPLASRTLQAHYDPLNYVQAAVLTDGTRINTQTLRTSLYVNPFLEAPEIYPTNFNTIFEDRIDHLLMQAVNFQLDTDEARSLGPWDYAQLDHASQRELRGAGLLAAWLGWFDCRFDNTRLRVVQAEGSLSELRHYFSDVGGGLGRSDWGFNWESENPNAFPWEFTKPAIDRGPGRMRTPFRVVRYHSIRANAAFEAMAEADARWMARRIARLSSEQLTDALIASGTDASETVLYRAKLMARRDRMVEHLGLQAQFPPLFDGEPQDVEFDPAADIIPSTWAGGREIRAKVSGKVIRAGTIVTPGEATLIGGKAGEGLPDASQN